MFGVDVDVGVQGGAGQQGAAGIESQTRYEVPVWGVQQACPLITQSS